MKGGSKVLPLLIRSTIPQSNLSHLRSILFVFHAIIFPCIDPDIRAIPLIFCQSVVFRTIVCCFALPDLFHLVLKSPLLPFTEAETSCYVWLPCVKWHAVCCSCKPYQFLEMRLTQLYIIMIFRRSWNNKRRISSCMTKNMSTELKPPFPPLGLPTKKHFCSVDKN